MTKYGSKEELAPQEPLIKKVAMLEVAVEMEMAGSSVTTLVQLRQIFFVRMVV